MVRQISKKCLKAFASIAVQCLHNQPKLRPTMAEVVVKLDSILLREREHLGSGVDDGRFINKVRYFLKGKADLVSTIKNDNVEAFHLDSFETIYRGWVDELTYAPTKSGVGLAVYVRTRHFGTTKLDLKPEEFNHPNLVKLLGYYLNNQKLSCVYERVPGQTLDELLFGGLAMQNEIYSFGVVLLEMLSGMEVHDWNRPFGEENLAKWAAPLLAHEANLGMILDKQLLDNNLPPKGAFIFAKLVSNCLQPAQDERPSMETILQVLRECYEEAV
ncbi:hypothetical protein R6Q59_027745 [Mikania micrantha]